MFLRCQRRKKDGKVHEYWSIVESRRLGHGRVAQRQVLYLGEINASQREAWRKTISKCRTPAFAARWPCSRPAPCRVMTSMRWVALVNEANAIRMTYILSRATSEAQGSEIRTVLREDADERLRWAGGKQDEPGRTANDLLDRLGNAAAAASALSPGGIDVFLSYAGRVIELQQERVMVRERSRIPGPYWAVLYIVAALALAAVGYQGGVSGASRSPVLLAVAIAFSAVIMVIADLDRPGEGFINVTQQPMVDLREMLSRSKP